MGSFRKIQATSLSDSITMGMLPSLIKDSISSLRNWTSAGLGLSLQKVSFPWQESSNSFFGLLCGADIAVPTKITIKINSNFFINFEFFVVFLCLTNLAEVNIYILNWKSRKCHSERMRRILGDKYKIYKILRLVPQNDRFDML